MLLAWLTSLVVMGAERDLGTSLLFFALFVVMLWVSTERATYLVLGAGLFAAGRSRNFDHVQTRVDVWLNPWEDVSGSGFQTVQATFALAGGVAGTGIRLGNPDQIPVAETDFIFAAIGEELGLVGATAVLIAYLLMVGAGLRIALRTEVPFEPLLATGLTALIGIQSFIIIAGVMRLLPLTGITLPFVSYGGSSLVANYVLLALLLRISDDTARRQESRPVTRQIRRLGVALMVCFVVLFVQLNRQVLRAEEFNDNPANTATSSATSAGPAGHHHRRRDGDARSVPSGDRFEYQREYPRRPVRPRHGLLSFTLGAGRREDLQRRAGRTHRRAVVRRGRRPVRRQGPHRRRHAHGAHRRAALAAPPTGPARRARSWRSTRAPAPSSPCGVPLVRPEPPVQPRHRAGDEAADPRRSPTSRCWPAPTGSASSPAPPSRS